MYFRIPSIHLDQGVLRSSRVLIRGRSTADAVKAVRRTFGAEIRLMAKPLLLGKAEAWQEAQEATQDPWFQFKDSPLLLLPGRRFPNKKISLKQRAAFIGRHGRLPSVLLAK